MMLFFAIAAFAVNPLLGLAVIGLWWWDACDQYKHDQQREADFQRDLEWRRQRFG